MTTTTQLSKTLRTETAHRLVDYDGPCAHLHGHSYVWTITVDGHKLLSNGLLIDFKEVKALAEKIIMPWDHALLLSRFDPLASLPREVLRATSGEEGRVFLYDWNPTVENMARHVLDRMLDALEGDLNNQWPIGVGVVGIRVRETVTSYCEVF